jgi:hypothetical protein
VIVKQFEEDFLGFIWHRFETAMASVGFSWNQFEDGR